MNRTQGIRTLIQSMQVMESKPLTQMILFLDPSYEFPSESFWRIWGIFFRRTLTKKVFRGIHPKEFIGRTDAPSKWSKLRDFHQSDRLLGHRSMQTIRKWFEPVLHKRFGVSTSVSISWRYQRFAPANWLFMNLNWFELMSDIHWTNKYAWNWGWFGGCNGKLQFAADDLRLANSANLIASIHLAASTHLVLPTDFGAKKHESVQVGRVAIRMGCSVPNSAHLSPYLVKLSTSSWSYRWFWWKERCAER